MYSLNGPRFEEVGGRGRRRNSIFPPSHNDKFTEWVLRCRVGLVVDAPKSLDLRPHCAVDLSFGVTLFDRGSPVDLTLTFGKSDQQFCHPVFDVDL